MEAQIICNKNKNQAPFNFPASPGTCGLSEKFQTLV